MLRLDGWENEGESGEGTASGGTARSRVGVR